jgi:hypothetical protein
MELSAGYAFWPQIGNVPVNSLTQIIILGLLH